MTDEAETTQELTTTAGRTDPHATAPDEDPMEHLGDVIPDPWDDEAQTDWRND